MSAFDKLYRSALPMKFFSRGWGKPDTLLKLIENINLVANREKFCKVVSPHVPIIIEKRTEHKNVILLEGSFTSPFDHAMPGILESENKIARFQVVLPKEWRTKYKPVCLHFAGTGDHTYSRRRLFLANKLLDDGIGSVIVMNPFYWKRKPKDQRGSSLNCVSDLFVMGGALISECFALLKWCEQNGYGPLGLHGISMGGYMASLCATVWPKPVSLIPCLSWTTASVVFVDGIMATAVDWNTLTKQYFSDSVYATTIRSRIQPSVPPCYRCPNETPDPFAASDAPEHHSSSTVHVEAAAPSENTQSTRMPRTVSTDGLAVDATQSSSSSTPPGATQTTPSKDSANTQAVLNVSNCPQPDSAALSGPQSSSRADWAKQYFPFNLYSLIHIPDALGSWNLPEALRRPLDASAWHSGVTLIRSLPDALVTNATSADPEVRQFMRELLDYFTHLGNFSPLVDPRLVLAVTAEQDAYVPRQGVVPLNRLYPGSEVRLLPQSGHVGAYVRNAIWTMDFRQAITDCMNRQVEFHFGEPNAFGPVHSKTSKNPHSTKRNY